MAKELKGLDYDCNGGKMRGLGGKFGGDMNCPALCRFCRSVSAAYSSIMAFRISTITDGRNTMPE